MTVVRSLFNAHENANSDASRDTAVSLPKMVSVASTDPSSRRAVTYPLNPLNGPSCTSTVCAPGGAVDAARSSDGSAAGAASSAPGASRV